MIETKRMWLREATADDIDQIIALEEHKDNRDFLWIGTRQEHQDEIDDPNHILLIFEKKQDRALWAMHSSASIPDQRYLSSAA